MAFVKGQSGNPGGRPKVKLADGTSLKELARKHTKTAVERLVKVMNDDDAPHSAIVGAASEILNRGWGRPVQQLGDGEGNAVDLIALLMERRAKTDG